MCGCKEGTGLPETLNANGPNCGAAVALESCRVMTWRNLPLFQKLGREQGCDEDEQRGVCQWAGLDEG